MLLTSTHRPGLGSYSRMLSAAGLCDSDDLKDTCEFAMSGKRPQCKKDVAALCLCHTSNLRRSHSPSLCSLPITFYPSDYFIEPAGGHLPHVALHLPGRLIHSPSLTQHTPQQPCPADRTLLMKQPELLKLVLHEMGHALSMLLSAHAAPHTVFGSVGFASTDVQELSAHVLER